MTKPSRTHFSLSFLFFFNDTATTEIYTLSLHDALPIWRSRPRRQRTDRLRAWRSTGEGTTAQVACPRRAHLRTNFGARPSLARGVKVSGLGQDRKSTRLNSSHPSISYAVFCLKKKKRNQ